MSKLLVVFGATGQQGGSVITEVLKEPELSKQYKIRGITRDASAAQAVALKNKSVEVVEADLTDNSSLQTALKGAHTTFAMTPSAFGPDAKKQEFSHGKAIADAAVAESVKYIIFSSLPHVFKISGGKYTRVTGFDAKAEVEDYILSLPIKSAFFSPGSFMQNFQGIMKPRLTESGDYVFATHVSPKTELPLIDVAGDSGKYIASILAEPDKYEGKTFCASTAVYSMEEMVEIMSKVTGKTIKYVQLPEDVFREHLPPWADSLVEMMLYQQDYGYYGPGTRDSVAWAAANARGKLSTFEEYLVQNPIALD